MFNNISFLSEINNSFNKLNFSVKPAETFDIVRCLREFLVAEYAGIVEISCGRKPVLSTMALHQRTNFPETYQTKRV